MQKFNEKWLRKLLFVPLFSLIALPMAAQEAFHVNGTVVDENSQPLIGVTVTEVGTTIGTATSANGVFALRASSPDAQIQFSYIGYAPKTFVASQVPPLVRLQEEAQKLSDVVVIGYGTQRKKELTGSVASIKEGDFNKGIQANPMGLIQGKVAGLTVIKNGGDDPAQNSYSVQLRGVGSLKGNDAPLYIIDGVPGGDLSSVLPSDISSIDVLKDGSAAAIYGTRANHGVILITTKRGTAGKSSVEYNGGVSTGFIANRPRVLTADEYRTYMVGQGRGIDWGGSTDWIDEITRTPINHTHAVSMAGGTDKFNYRASVGYRALQGVALKSDYDEINGRFAANQKALNNKLQLSYDFSYTTNKRNWANYDVFNQAVRLNPTKPVRMDGDPAYEKYNGYFEDGAFYTNNALAMINERQNLQKNSVMLGSVRAALSITDQLQFSSFYTLQQGSQWNGRYESKAYGEVVGNPLNGKAEQEQFYDQMQVIENTLQYTNSFDLHNVQAIVGQSYQLEEHQQFSSMNTDYPMDFTEYNNLGLGTGIQTGKPSSVSVGSNKYSDKLASFFARVLYNYNSKYYLNASVRMEGSSKFGPEADPTLGRWGLFPAVSASWRISEEDFMQGVSVVNDLKLRVGYGVTGNMPGDHYIYLMRVGQTGSEIFMNGAFVKPWGLQSNENPNLRWEKKHEYNVGVDFALFGNRLSGAVDAYLRNTVDLLWEYNVPMPPYPFGTKWDNYGQLSNKGVELSLNYAIVQNKDYDWNVGLVMAKNWNRVDKITGGEYANNNAGYLDVGAISSGDGETGTNVMRLQEGEPIGNFYGFKFAGIKSDGTWMFYTPAGGFTPSPTQADKQILGNAQPFATFGLNTAAHYKNFDLSLNFRGQFGGLIFNEMRYFYENTTGAENVLLSAVSSADQIWANRNDPQRDASKLNAIRRFSDYYLEDATYLKLSDVTLGYTFALPESVQKYVTNLRLYLTAQNLFTITTYSGMDPEVSMSGLTPGFDGRSYYPRQRTVLFGASLTF
jgi:TonB-linked SusC/RagA family outer membrane protein